MKWPRQSHYISPDACDACRLPASRGEDADICVVMITILTHFSPGWVISFKIYVQLTHDIEILPLTFQIQSS